MPSSSANAHNDSATPYFRRDGDYCIPTEIAHGGWRPTLSGHVTDGLFSWAAERTIDGSDFQPARLTVDLPAQLR